MNAISEIRRSIHDHFHGSDKCQQYFFGNANKDEYAAYYTAMSLLQDSTDGVWYHRSNGFSGNPLLAYIEFWGIMQAIIIQQDCIMEIHRVVVGGVLDVSQCVKWREIRLLRNICAGHPVNQGVANNHQRSYMGRRFGDYRRITIEVWQEARTDTIIREVNLGALIDGYATEAASHLRNVYETMQLKWP